MEYLFISIILLIIFTAIVTILSKIQSLETRIIKMNETLDQVADQLGLPEHRINDELRKLLKDGKDVKAVKEARLAMGLSLIEAKKYIEKLKQK